MSSTNEADYEHWCDHGYVVIQLLDDGEVEAALENIYEYMPPWDAYRGHARWYAETVGSTTNPSATHARFPFVGDALNHTTIHPDLVAFAERVIGTERIMLGHGQMQGKYAGTREFEQNLHCDYVNNTLAFPKPDAQIIELPAIMYYTDVTVDLGPTYVVPQDVTRGDPLVPHRRSREEYPDLYDQEIPVVVPAGSVLIYSMNTFHRGSGMRASEGVRFSQNISFKRVDAPWAGQATFQHSGGRPEMDRFLTNASPREREMVGFPPAGDSYWDETTIAGVGARYPGMDMTPYAAGERRRIGR
jgi:hypothetical protein